MAVSCKCSFAQLFPKQCSLNTDVASPIDMGGAVAGESSEKTSPPRSSQRGAEAVEGS